MIAFITLTTLVTATLLAGFVAVGMQWLLLQAATRLMRPATARREFPRTHLAHGTMRLARVAAVRRR
jgi:hypothetical protein